MAGKDHRKFMDAVVSQDINKYTLKSSKESQRSQDKIEFSAH
jgi:hypothetical protein